jgi:HK97 family phage prohead protease
MDERNHTRPSYDGFLTKALDPLAFKANAEQGVLSGYASLWYVVDSYGEFTVPGAFARSISERGPESANPRIVLRYEHEYTIGTHTKMVEDEKGLYIEAAIADDGMYGTVLRRQLAAGVPYGLSIGFRRVKQREATVDDPLDLTSAPRWIVEMAAQDPSFLTGLTEVKHLEDSTVTFPAVDPAMVDDYRSDDLNGRALERVLTDLKAGRLTPSHLATLKSIAQAMPADRTPEHERDARSTTPPSDSTPKAMRNYAAELLLAELGVRV